MRVDGVADLSLQTAQRFFGVLALVALAQVVTGPVPGVLWLIWPSVAIWTGVVELTACRWG